MAGYIASETLAAYTTTKFGVLGLSEALRDELHRHGIGVTAVCPGIINTADHRQRAHARCGRRAGGARAR